MSANVHTINMMAAEIMHREKATDAEKRNILNGRYRVRVILVVPNVLCALYTCLRVTSCSPIRSPKRWTMPNSENSRCKKYGTSTVFIHILYTHEETESQNNSANSQCEKTEYYYIMFLHFRKK